MLSSISKMDNLSACGGCSMASDHESTPLEKAAACAIRDLTGLVQQADGEEVRKLFFPTPGKPNTHLIDQAGLYKIEKGQQLKILTRANSLLTSLGDFLVKTFNLQGEDKKPLTEAALSEIEGPLSFALTNKAAQATLFIHPGDSIYDKENKQHSRNCTLLFTPKNSNKFHNIDLNLIFKVASPDTIIDFEIDTKNKLNEALTLKSSDYPVLEQFIEPLQQMFSKARQQAKAA